MCTSLDVAAYILAQQRPLTTVKLQKLVYYSQAWSLVWDEKPLFKDKIKAWASGPVATKLYCAHRGKYDVRRILGGDGRRLTKTQKDSIDTVLGFYGDKSSQWLVDLTHKERPWREAREGLVPGERGDKVISHEAMHEYYSGLFQAFTVLAKRARKQGNIRPSSKKTPITVEIPESKKPIRFCFRSFDKDFCVSDGDWQGIPFEDVAHRLKSYSTRTWGQIEQNTKRDHPISINKIISKAQTRLRTLNLDDYEQLWSFHLEARWRVWGIREGRFFRVLWWDPEHLIYPVTPIQDKGKNRR